MTTDEASLDRRREDRPWPGPLATRETEPTRAEGSTRDAGPAPGAGSTHDAGATRGTGAAPPSRTSRPDGPEPQRAAGPDRPDHGRGRREEARRGGDRRRATRGTALDRSDGSGRPGASSGPGRADGAGGHGTPAARPGGVGAVRGAAALLVVLLVALAGGWAVTQVTPPTWTTQAKVLVLPAGDAAGQATSASAVAVQVPTWAALAQTPAVLDPAVEASGVDVTSTQAVRDVSAAPEPGTSIVTIEADASTGPDAASLASATAASLVEQIAVRSTVGEVPLVAGAVVEEPEIPAEPASPDLLLNLAVAAAVGLAVGAAVLVAARAVAVRREQARQTGARTSARAGDGGRDGDGTRSGAGASRPTAAAR